jgi:hypothetical protein
MQTELDPDTAERIVVGAVAPDDAPPGYAEVTVLLRSLTLPGFANELARERETVQAMAAVLDPALPEGGSRSARGRFGRRLALLGAVVLLGGGSALAGVGASRGNHAPGTGRPTPSVTTAGPHVGAPPASRVESDGDDGASADGQGKAGATPSSTKGSEISKPARETTSTGVEKGAVISTAASGGKSQAGMHGKASADHGSGQGHRRESRPEGSSEGLMGSRRLRHGIRTGPPSSSAGPESPTAGSA